MTDRKRQAFIVFSLLCVALCTALAVWQWQRHLWKTDLLYQMGIQRTAGAKAIGPSDVPAPFTPITLRGAFVQHPSFHILAKPYEGKVGEWAAHYFKATNGQSYLIKLGWIPKNTFLQLPNGTIELEGYVMPPPSTNAFTPANDTARRAWHTLNLQELGTSVAAFQQAPFYILNRSLQAPGLKILPLNGGTANNHFQYTLTWGMLALMILGGLIVSLRSKNCGH